MSTGTDNAVGEDTGTAGGKEGVFKRKRIVVVGAHLGGSFLMSFSSLARHRPDMMPGFSNESRSEGSRPSGSGGSFLVSDDFYRRS